MSEVDDGGAVFAVGSERRATQVGVVEGRLFEADGAVRTTLGSEIRAAQIGVGEVGPIEARLLSHLCQRASSRSDRCGRGRP